MSCTKCEKSPVSDEKCFDRMSDGRQFTNWKPSCTIFAQQQHDSQKGSSYDQRMWLINNAESLMQKDRLTLPGGVCVPCFSHNETGTMLPELEKQSCNKTYCEFSKNDNMGLGLGRNFQSS
jgi:hypothetical protein